MLRTKFAVLFIFLEVLFTSACVYHCPSVSNEYLGASIDLVDNSGRKPESLIKDTILAKSFAIYFGLRFESPIIIDDCTDNKFSIPQSLKVYTIYNFNQNYPSGADITSAFGFLNSDSKYPINLNGATIQEHNYFILNYLPNKDTIQQFVIESYRENRLISIDTTRPIFLKR